MSKYLSIFFAVLLVFSLINSNHVQAQNGINTQNNGTKIPNNTKVLAVSRTNLNTDLTKVGDYFCAKLVENITVGQEIIAPSGSTVCGNVTQVKKPTRLSRDGAIIISINQLQTPQGQTISLAGREIKGIVISPYTKKLPEKVAETVPTRAAGYGTTIPLNESTDLNGGVVYAIGLGASMVTGAISGFFDPDVGKKRGQTALYRAYEQTPIGAARGVINKGKPAKVNTGDGLVFNLDKPTIAKLQTEYYAQIGQPTIATR